MRQSWKRIIIATLLLGAFAAMTMVASPARAECDQFCFLNGQTIELSAHQGRHHTGKHQRRFDANANAVAGTSPDCRRWLPFTCGCELSLKIFHRVVNSPNLKLASTWAHVFPQTAPAPDMVAARSGHAFQLLSHVRGNIWLVWDPNSGGHRVHVHERSIAGYRIVNPFAGRVASL